MKIPVIELLFWQNEALTLKLSELEVENKQTEAQLSAATGGRPKTARPVSRMMVAGKVGKGGKGVGWSFLLSKVFIQNNTDNKQTEAHFYTLGGGVLCYTLRTLSVRPFVHPSSICLSLRPSALCFRALTLVPFDLFSSNFA